MGDPCAKASICVSVVYSPAARTVHERSLLLEAPATVADALRCSGLLDAVEVVALHPEHLGLWGRRVSPGAALRDGDRVEVYRPLRVDPKVARRERFEQQGARGAGLFSQRRSNAKPGY
ncbi:MAG: RnfH family protein [Betaproteobacteria bacterium]